MKFEIAYSNYDLISHSITDIAMLYEKRTEMFIQKYKNSFVCPECKKAALSFVAASVPYFRTYPHAQHKKNCDLAQACLTGLAAKKFASKPENQEVIQHDLQSLIKREMAAEAKIEVTSEAISEIIIPQRGRKSLFTHQRKKPLHKRIDFPFRPDDFNCFKYFVGKIRLQWEIQNSVYKILIYPRFGSSKLIGKLYIPSKVYKSIPPQWKIKSYECWIAFMSSLEERKRKSGEGSYFEGEISLNQFLQIELI